MDKSTTFAVTDRTRVHRRPGRASYDRALAYSILDEALFGSVGFVIDGEPFVIPMAVARWDDRLLLHGAPASGVLRAGAAGARVCVTVTLVDGIVLARSAMHHSLNYRSVVVLGSAVEIVDGDEKRRALVRIVDHVLPGRSANVRPPNERELRATRVLALPIEEASVKTRAGGPLDDEEDLASTYWAGELPVRSRVLDPIPDALHAPRGEVPPDLATYGRGKGWIPSGLPREI
jgi:nitroimidazol reductase NimA-like FMN-containing flavoprotein (pyridoxamine 5'-phosphate oxidase superfamily)